MCGFKVSLKTLTIRPQLRKADKPWVERIFRDIVSNATIAFVRGFDQLV